MRKFLIISSFLTLLYSQCDVDTWQDYLPNLDGCELSDADLYGVDFSYTSFNDANLSGANLGNCDFSYSSMLNADLSGAFTLNANFEGALMCGVDVDSLTGYSGNPETVLDCFDVCGGTGQLDECGVCDGDGTACFGCMDPFATNYSELAIYDDGSCEYYDGEISNQAPPKIWDRFSPSPQLVGSTGWINNFDKISCVEVENNNILCSYNWYVYFNGATLLADYLNDYDLDNGNIIIVEKFTNEGELIWSNSIEISENCGSNSMYGLLFHGESYYLYGLDRVDCDDDYNEAYVAKIDNSGNAVWANNYYTLPEQNNDSHLIEAFSLNNGNIILFGNKNNQSVEYGSEEQPYTIIIDNDGNLVDSNIINIEDLGVRKNVYIRDLIVNNEGGFTGYGYYNSEEYVNTQWIYEYYHVLIKFDNEGNYLGYSSFEYDLYNYEPKSLAQFNNGNYLLVGKTNIDRGYMILTNSDGDFIIQGLDGFEFNIDSEPESYFDHVTSTSDNKMLISGKQDKAFYAEQGLLFKIDESLNIEWIYNYGDVPSYNDNIVNTKIISDSKILITGTSVDFIANPNYDSAYFSLLHYESGCMVSSACNYNPVASIDDGSCFFEDACDVCDGNGYDFCDDDGDGVNNFDQWGYGAYNLEAVDAPDDQGGNLLFNFNKSFYDSDELQGRNESYTIELYQDSLWYVAQSFGAYGADTYNVIVPTLHDNQETTFRVIAHMDEGNFVSQEYATGMSVDNIAPAVPTSLGGDFSDGSVNMAWSAPEDDDFAYFNVYRDSLFYSTTILSEFVDVELPNIPEVTYEVSAVDSNGNESALSDPLDVLLCLNGDMNEDYQLDVLDVILVMEHILDFYEYQPGECETDLNMDGALDILDVVMLVTIIVNGGPE